MFRRLFVLLALVLAATALIAACGDDEDDADSASPTATSTAASGGATGTATQAAGAYPVTITDMLGREVTIESEPQRIVAASPSAIELLYAAGGEAIARSSTARVPAEVASLPDIGRAEQPALEQIVAQNPDLVLADSSIQAAVADQFESALGDVPVVFVGATKYDDVAASLEIIGEVINQPEEAAAAVKEMEDAKAAAEEVAEGKTPPRVLILVGAANDSYAGLSDSFVGDMVAILRGENIAEGQPQAGPIPGYTRLSIEQIVAANPEVILAATAGPPGGPTLADGIKADPAYANLDAVKNGRVHDLDVEVFLQAPGPRAADGLTELASLLYPEGAATQGSGAY